LLRQGLIGFRPILREAVGVLEVVGLELRTQHAIELIDDLVERPASPRPGVVDAAFLARIA
jgi:hypothetical protein